MWTVALLVASIITYLEPRHHLVYKNYMNLMKMFWMHYYIITTMKKNENWSEWLNVTIQLSSYIMNPRWTRNQMQVFCIFELGKQNRLVTKNSSRLVTGDKKLCLYVNFKQTKSWVTWKDNQHLLQNKIRSTNNLCYIYARQGSLFNKWQPSNCQLYVVSSL